METEGGSSCCRSHQWVLMVVCILSLPLENGECVCVSAKLCWCCCDCGWRRNQRDPYGRDIGICCLRKGRLGIRWVRENY